MFRKKTQATNPVAIDSIPTRDRLMPYRNQLGRIVRLARPIVNTYKYVICIFFSDKGTCNECEAS